MHTSPDPLDALIERWRSAPPSPGPIVPEVWRRIAADETLAGKSGWWARVAFEFARPTFAAVFVAACVLLGLFLAEVRVSRLHAQRDRQLAQSYLQLIDPLLAPDSSRSPPGTPRS